MKPEVFHELLVIFMLSLVQIKRQSVVFSSTIFFRIIAGILELRQNASEIDDIGFGILSDICWLASHPGFFFWLIACEFWRIIFPLSWTSFMNPPYYLFQTRYFHSIFYQFSLISRTSLLLGRNSQYHELIFYVVRQFCNAIIFFSKVYKLVS